MAVLSDMFFFLSPLSPACKHKLVRAGWLISEGLSALMFPSATRGHRAVSASLSSPGAANTLIHIRQETQLSRALALKIINRSNLEPAAQQPSSPQAVCGHSEPFEPPTLWSLWSRGCFPLSPRFSPKYPARKRGQRAKKMMHCSIQLLARVIWMSKAWQQTGNSPPGWAGRSLQPAATSINRDFGPRFGVSICREMRYRRIRSKSGRWQRAMGPVFFQHPQ